MSARRHVAAAAIFTALAILHTWPLATAPGTLSRVDNGDYTLNAWALSWVVHQAPRNPLRLFDANIFYPEPRTLAFSEHLVPQAVLAAPVRLFGGSAVLTYNLVLLAGFVLTGWSMAYVVAQWTGDWWAGLVAGSLLAFNTHHLLRLAHIQALHVYYLPLALLALDSLFRRRRWRDAVAFGALCALQGLTSGYWLVFTAAAGVAAISARVPEWWPRRGVPAAQAFRPLLLFGAAALVAAAIVTPFLLPYWFARQEQGLTRSMRDAAMYSARGVEYVKTAARLYEATPLRWGRDGLPADAFFPGVAAVLLAVIACGGAALVRDGRVRMLLLIAIAGALLSLGPHTRVYAWLHVHVALLQGIRAPSRFGVLVVVGIAALAGLGLASLRSRLHGHRDATRASDRGPARLAPLLLGVVALVAVNAEAFRAPIGYTPFHGFSPVYTVVARLEGAVIAEFPVHQPPAFFLNAPYMLASTVHWKPMVNGYSGFLPDSYRRLALVMTRFPEPDALDLLREVGVTHVIIHRDQFGAGGDHLLQAITASGQFQPVAQDESVRLFRILPGIRRF